MESFAQLWLLSAHLVDWFANSSCKASKCIYSFMVLPFIGARFTFIESVYKYYIVKITVKNLNTITEQLRKRRRTNLNYFDILNALSLETTYHALLRNQVWPNLLSKGSGLSLIISYKIFP